MNNSGNEQKRESEKRNKRTNLSPTLALFVVFCAIIWFIGAYIIGTGRQETLTFYAAPLAQDIVPTNNPRERFLYEILTYEQLAQISNDHLLLVNRQYAVPSSITSNLINVSSQVWTLDTSILLDEHVLNMLRIMFDSASSVGFTQFRVTEGFRTLERQQTLYNSMAETGLAAPPNHSEHQVGFAVDISYQGVNISNSRQGAWLMENSYKYGFILRYPAHKTEITGFPFEPWHYRYIGLPHAYFMHTNDFVLEEYIDYLREHREISIVHNRTFYTVFYLSCTYETIEIPTNYSFSASRDNTGGIIVTVWAS